MSVAVSTSQVRVAPPGGTTQRRPTTRSRWSRAGFNLIAVVVFVASAFPVYWMLQSSFLPTGKVRALTPTFFPGADFTLQNYDTAIFDSQRDLFARPDFRGCAFAAATAEGPVGGPNEERSRRYRTYVRSVFADVLRQAGIERAEDVAAQLHLVYDGAQMSARMDSHPADPAIAANARRLVEGLLDAVGLTS